MLACLLACLPHPYNTSHIYIYILHIYHHQRSTERNVVILLREERENKRKIYIVTVYIIKIVIWFDMHIDFGVKWSIRSSDDNFINHHRSRTIRNWSGAVCLEFCEWNSFKKVISVQEKLHQIEILHIFSC